jgi:hypothetical protein
MRRGVQECQAPWRRVDNREDRSTAAVGEGAALEKGIELVLDETRRSAPTLASVFAMKSSARCCTRQYGAVCSGRWRS